MHSRRNACFIGGGAPTSCSNGDALIIIAICSEGKEREGKWVFIPCQVLKVEQVWFTRWFKILTRGS